MANTIHNPGTPYVGPIPFSLQEGVQIHVSGTPEHHHNGFLISLQAGPSVDPRSDCALAFNPRFSENSVVRNTLQSGSWGAEERHGGFPFRKGHNCDVTIMVKHGQFKINVNGSHFADYNCRMAMQRVSHITVEQGLRIKHIKFDHGHHHGGAFPPGPPPAGAYPGGGSTAPIYNPPVPFVHSLGGMYPNKMIFISGIPHPNPSSFSVNLICGTDIDKCDIALHIDARFNHLGCRNILVRNTRQRGQWGPEERSVPYFPFQADAYFDLMVLVMQDHYKVAVNNQHLLEYYHRIQPISRVDTLRIDGDVRLTQVRFQ